MPHLQWEAYTLGQAATSPDAGRDLTNAQQAAISNNVDIARAAGHRYLVQRWGDGTPCDKTGEPREIEVQVHDMHSLPACVVRLYIDPPFTQFHCSMTMADTILFVKETKTCHYVMVINTPRLCGEPGFKNRLEQRDETFIRCREVLESVDAINAVDRSLPDSSHPYWHGSSKPPVLSVPPPPPPAAAQEHAAVPTKNKKPADLLRRALEVIVSGGKDGEGDNGESAVRIKKGDDGEIWIEFLDENADLDGLDEDLESLLTSSSDKWESILRRNSEDPDDKRGDGSERGKRNKKAQRPDGVRDEL